MSIHQQLAGNGVLEIIFDLPPVNALDIASLGELVQILDSVADRAEVRVVLLRSEGRGFIGGGDVKEVQRLPDFEGILGQARGSLAASVALQDCAVPVIAAVHNYCIGLGVLLAGCCDIVLANPGASFVLAEVDNGATGGAIQAIGLMPDKRLRAAMFTCEPVTAEELASYGTVYQLVETSQLPAAARKLADTIAAKPPDVVRAAKRAINGSTGRDLRELYRKELAYTFELNMTGSAHTARETFVSGERKGYLSDT